MNIISAQYQRDSFSNENISIVASIDGQTKYIPLDPSNRHYVEILRQVEAGTLTIQEAE